MPGVEFLPRELAQPGVRLPATCGCELLAPGVHRGRASGASGVLNKWSSINGLPEDQDEVLRRIDEIGGPTSYNNYPVGWTWAGATPFQWFKQIASYLGGTRNGMVTSWASRISGRGRRSHFGHAIDVMPTILFEYSGQIKRLDVHVLSGLGAAQAQHEQEMARELERENE